MIVLWNRMWITANVAWRRDRTISRSCNTKRARLAGSPRINSWWRSTRSTAAVSLVYAAFMPVTRMFTRSERRTDHKNFSWNIHELKIWSRCSELASVPYIQNRLFQSLWPSITHCRNSLLRVERFTWLLILCVGIMDRSFLLCVGVYACVRHGSSDSPAASCLITPLEYTGVRNSVE
jgi:hypothetical protein